MHKKNSDFGGVLYKKFREAGRLPGVRGAGESRGMGGGWRLEAGRPRPGASIKGRVSYALGSLGSHPCQRTDVGETKARSEIETWR